VQHYFSLQCFETVCSAAAGSVSYLLACKSVAVAIVEV